jgi:hypothetical protein
MGLFTSSETGITPEAEGCDSAEESGTCLSSLGELLNSVAKEIGMLAARDITSKAESSIVSFEPVFIFAFSPSF